jgi:hypothetical protein
MVFEFIEIDFTGEPTWRVVTSCRGEVPVTSNSTDTTGRVAALTVYVISMRHPRRTETHAAALTAHETRVETTDAPEACESASGRASVAVVPLRPRIVTHSPPTISAPVSR